MPATTPLRDYIQGLLDGKGCQDHLTEIRKYLLERQYALEIDKK